ncbi:MAG: A/G-specific adenine glycosylase, partial [Campylobacterota bacterium]
MLQQTQVSRVLHDYYFQFLNRFPSLLALSRAREDEVLHAWQGLGYYSRARNMKKTATLVPHGLPASYKQLRKLPGIGEYTANAVLCFGFHKRAAIVDANIKRVLKRLYAQKDDKDLQQKAQKFLNTHHPFDHNQAMLDLGALVCTPKNPHCTACPLVAICAGKDDPESFSQKKKIQTVTKNLHLLVRTAGDKIAVQKSSQTLYKNLWGFEQYDSTPGGDYLGGFGHSYTKYRLKVYVYRQQTERILQGQQWVSLREMRSLPMSALARKALDFVLQ